MTFSAWTNKLNPQKQRIRQQILNDPYYRFASLEEVAIAAELGIKIEVSCGNVDDFLRLPGISIHQARNLVELINNGVEILSLEDLSAALNIPQQRLKPLAPILSFCYYDPDSILTPQKININTATFKQLQDIPSLDNFIIQKLINNRQEYGNYKNLIDLQKRLGINSQIISQLMHYLQF
ncbi:ComEA family DNA-binding protein [Crocosphaera sp. XPORK-15E]|uniref:ComEA family DNA-binding protein n=1 Tax=Crocosphaera sp. XPORK-15E TaxID=3110247 RepID=UPI002B21BD1B|nr:ComEA family DNA-binding protein [Crocosphaera sp. XPORK-15E]MEA5533313.1 ComEA family DNA-binding protein [Crocosphaera sp. XPORK-15E]